ncbi:MAG TPA: hypothetical protein PK264_05215 [Hyphomicrobiaceae bacterium]|nr:hypothetical protein [Hyphomicrobiaceae bacterium]
MSQKPSSNLSAFAAAGALLIAWWMAPSATAPDVVRAYGTFTSGMFAVVGAVLAIQAIKTAERRPSPWASMLGRVAWALRPRGWIIAWAAIFVAVAVAGTPHLAVSYAPRPCIHAGLKGFVTTSGPCPWFRWL